MTQQKEISKEKIASMVDELTEIFEDRDYDPEVVFCAMVTMIGRMQEKLGFHAEVK